MRGARKPRINRTGPGQHNWWPDRQGRPKSHQQYNARHPGSPRRPLWVDVSNRRRTASADHLACGNESTRELRGSSAVGSGGGSDRGPRSPQIKLPARPLARRLLRARQQGSPSGEGTGRDRGVPVEGGGGGTRAWDRSPCCERNDHRQSPGRSGALTHLDEPTRCWLATLGWRRGRHLGAM